MKYIRTKDAIINLSYVCIGVDNGWKSKEEYIAFKQEEQIEKIKVADTIEELCDCFIYKKQVFKTLREAIDYAPNFSTIYGAIWTTGKYIQPILLSVAETTMSGELRLL